MIRYASVANTDNHFLVRGLDHDALETLYLQLRQELGMNSDKPWVPGKDDDSEEMKAKRALYDMVSDEYCSRRSAVDTTLVSDMLWERVLQQSDKGESGRPNSSNEGANDRANASNPDPTDKD